MEIDYFRWDLIEKMSNIQVLGNVMYTDYAYLFILASFIYFLVAMIGAIVLTFCVRTNIKGQDTFIQISHEGGINLYKGNYS